MWGKWPKSAKNCWFWFYYPHTSRESVSPVCGIFWIASLRFLPNLCHIDHCKSIWGIYFLVKSQKKFCGHSGLYKPSFELLSRNSWEAELHFFITTNLQTVVRGAQGHPTGRMISTLMKNVLETDPLHWSFFQQKYCKKTTNMS